MEAIYSWYMINGYDKIVPERRRVDVAEGHDLVIGVEKSGGGGGAAAGDVAEHAPVDHRRPLRHPPGQAAAPEAEGLPHGATPRAGSGRD